MERAACIYYSNGFTENAKGIMSFYKAHLGAQMNRFVDKSCKTDTDCNLVPSCYEYYYHRTPCQIFRLDIGKCKFFYETDKEIADCKKDATEEMDKCEIEYSDRGSSPAPPKGTFLPANKNYVSACQGPVLCNNKCRCDDSDLKEKKVECVNSRCLAISPAIATDEEAPVPVNEEKDMVPQPEPDPQINPGTTNKQKTSSGGGATQ